MSTAVGHLSPADFEPIVAEQRSHGLSRPSLSYWEDSWRRLKQNRRAFASLGIIIVLGTMAIAGPSLWRVDPAAQNVDETSDPPSLPASAVIGAPHTAWLGVTVEPTSPGNVV